MGLGATNKRKGSSAERGYAKVFRDLGFTFCKTSREGSRVHDNAGIDLINIPLNVQIKAGYPRGLNQSKELAYISDKVKELFPPGDKEHTLPKVLIHKKNVGRGIKRTEFDEIVSMTMEDFIRILKLKI